MERDWIIVYSRIPVPDGEKRPRRKESTPRKSRQPRYPWSTTTNNLLRDLWTYYHGREIAAVLNKFFPEPGVDVTDKMVIRRANDLGLEKARRRKLR